MSFRIFCFAILSLLSSRAQAQADASTSRSVQRLDAVVVSAGPDPKTSFDLAQGTSVLSEIGRVHV